MSDTTGDNTTPQQTMDAVGKKGLARGKKAIEKRNQVLTQLKIEYVPIMNLKPNTYNPNRQSEHDFELLCHSMQEDGFTQPIIAQKNCEIVDGEHRWRAAQVLGFKEIPVVFVDMTVEQMKIATLRHNRARGTEDYELSAKVLKDLQELGALSWAQDSLMLSDEDVNRMLDDAKAVDLAAETFSNAWEPDSTSQADMTIKAVEDGNLTRASTSGALQVLHQRENALKNAKNDQEREMIRRDADIYRISLVFTGDEAKTVRATLGDRPAETLVAICRGLDRDAAGAATKGKKKGK